MLVGDIKNANSYQKREPVECNDPIYNTQFTAGFPKFIAELTSSISSSISTPSTASTSCPSTSAASTAASTSFKLLKHNPAHNTSLVLCTPTTGRTHQIRKHLAVLGYPIQNDEVYKGEGYRAFGGALKRYLKTYYQAPNSGATVKATEVGGKQSENDKDNKENAENLEMLKKSFEHVQHTLEASTRETELAERCQECGAKMYKDQEVSVDRMRIYLHAVRYTFMDGEEGEEENKGERFETGMPDWALV